MSKRGQRARGPWLRLSEIDLGRRTARLADARSSVPCQNWPAPWSSPNRGSATWCSPVDRVSDELCSIQKIRGLGPKALQSSAAWPALILVAVIGHMADPKSRVSPSHAISPILASMPSEPSKSEHLSRLTDVVRVIGVRVRIVGR